MLSEEGIQRNFLEIYFFSMSESEPIPASWVSSCNEVDEIWVPSYFHVEIFQQAGVNSSKILRYLILNFFLKKEFPRQRMCLYGIRK
jgi:hypothetical protein